MDYNRYNSYPSYVLGFHGCDKEVALEVLNGKSKLKDSKNKWDWLGHGIYFWEQNPQRAFQHAKDIATGNQKANSEVKTPFVLGAIIDLGKCLNLMDPGQHTLIKTSFLSLKKTLEADNVNLPQNIGKARILDCTVFMHLHNMMKENGDTSYDTVRGAFPEGNPIYEGCAIHDRTHIQICVRNPDAIIGYFLPFPLRKINPNL